MRITDNQSILNTDTMWTLWISINLRSAITLQEWVNMKKTEIIHKAISSQRSTATDSKMILRHRNTITVKSLNILQETARDQERDQRSKLLWLHLMSHSAELHVMTICAECIKVIRTASDDIYNRISKRRTVKNMTQQIYSWKSWMLYRN